MREFDELIEILDRLMGPEGCPWDRVQTLQSLRSTILEEVCEVIEAINFNDDAHIKEELGDLFLNIVFLSKIAEKDQRFPLKDILTDLNEKLIRRHPHIFTDGKKIDTVEELHEQWDLIKKEEKGKEKRESILDGIPKELPPLARAQKILKRMKKGNDKSPISLPSHPEIKDEKELGEHLLSLAMLAVEKNIDIEQALRKSLALLERDLLRDEKKHL